MRRSRRLLVARPGAGRFWIWLSPMIVLAGLIRLANVETAGADTLSTSVLQPTPLASSGVVEAAFPESGKATYYVSFDAQAGDLLTQIGYSGRPGAQKSIDLAVLDADAHARENYWCQGTEPADDSTRSFAIDRSGKQVLRLEVEGPPTARFRVEVGGSAAAALAPKSGPGEGALSRSVFTPTPLDASGSVTGKLPGPDRKEIYYVALDVQPGDLLTQISVTSREGADKSLDLKLLQPNARVGEQYWVLGSSATEEKTRSFAIDSTRRQIVKLVVSGPETGTFKAELGGSALAKPAGQAEGVAGRATRPSQ